jgi:hypothetical protein
VSSLSAVLAPWSISRSTARSLRTVPALVASIRPASIVPTTVAIVISSVHITSIAACTAHHIVPRRRCPWLRWLSRLSYSSTGGLRDRALADFTLFHLHIASTELISVSCQGLHYGRERAEGHEGDALVQVAAAGAVPGQGELRYRSAGGEK